MPGLSAILVMATEAFFEVDKDKVQSEIETICIYFVTLATGFFVATFVQMFLFAMLQERLTTREGLIVAARRYPSIYFILMNTNPCHAVPAPPAYHQCIPPLPNVILLNATADALKPAFIRTCDAMIHGRENGEMFGLALAEFSVMRRPIFTCGPKAPHLNARAHLDMLGEKAFVHSGRSVDELVQQIGSFDRRRAAALGEYWNAYSTYAPEPVMRAFECVFLQRSSGSGGRCRAAPASSASTMLQDDPCESCQPYSSPRANGCVKPR